MYRPSNLLVILLVLENTVAVLGQLVNGSFGLATTDPICIQCQDAVVEWYGGIPPYILSVSGYHNSYALANVGTTRTNRMKWHVNFPAGTRLWFQLSDGNRTNIYTNIVTVASSADASCVNVTNPLVTDPDTSSTLGSATTLRSAAAESASATDTPNQASSLNNTIAPIAGGIVGGFVVLLALLFCLWWFIRKNKRRMITPQPQDGLDLDEGGYVAEPFTVQATGGVSRIGHTPKMRTITVSNFTAPRLDYSSSGVSMPTAGDATPSSSMPLIHNESPTIGALDTPVAVRKERRIGSRDTHNVPVQEQDAGVSLSGGLQSDGHTTLPPAYDNSWRM
ncbi:hypothetical protein B0J17DRAFT_637068 [Rhizoctonia solani]|nr:hypothetical protein B0J17DRAFT_637068 [Rhizoctonia solani]